MIDVAGHPESRLMKMKQDHENRIARLTAMAPSMHSHMVIYKANIGNNSPVLTYENLRDYLLPTHYPADDRVIDLSLTNSPQRDKDAAFWQTELDVLDKHFNEKLKERIKKQEITHLSLFALAPIPLLIKLGILLNDIQHVRVHQPVRNPKSWRLSDAPDQIVYLIQQKAGTGLNVALNLSLSATITNDRIYDILGNDATIYTLTIKLPFNDFLKNQVHLDDFSKSLKLLMDKIKKEQGLVPLHIFPAIPVATAIEFGRTWMPKADMPLHIYDQNTANMGFKKVIEIHNS